MARRAKVTNTVVEYVQRADGSVEPRKIQCDQLSSNLHAEVNVGYRHVVDSACSCRRTTCAKNCGMSDECLLI